MIKTQAQPLGKRAEQGNRLVPKVGVEPTRPIGATVFETAASTIPPLRLVKFRYN